MPTSSVLRFNSLKTYASDITLGWVCGRVALEIQRILRSKIYITPWLKKDVSLEPARKGDTISWEVLENTPTIETVTSVNWDSDPVVSTKEIGEESMSIDKHYRFCVEVPLNRAAFSQNWTASNAAFLDDGKFNLAETAETAVADFLYQNAGNTYLSTGGTTGNTYLKTDDFIELASMISQRDPESPIVPIRMDPADFLGFVSDYDMKKLKKTINTTVPYLDKFTWTNLQNDSREGYEAWRMKFIEYPFAPKVTGTSPVDYTYHNLFLNRDHIIIGTKSLLPPDEDAQIMKAHGITMSGVVDDKLGMSIMVTMGATGRPTKKYWILVELLFGIAYKRSVAGIDVQSVYTPAP